MEAVSMTSNSLDLAYTNLALQEIRQHSEGRGALEKVRPSQRLERRSRTQTPHG